MTIRLPKAALPKSTNVMLGATLVIVTGACSVSCTGADWVSRAGAQNSTDIGSKKLRFTGSLAPKHIGGRMRCREKSPTHCLPPGMQMGFSRRGLHPCFDKMPPAAKSGLLTPRRSIYRPCWRRPIRMPVKTPKDVQRYTLHMPVKKNHINSARQRLGQIRV